MASEAAREKRIGKSWCSLVLSVCAETASLLLEHSACLIQSQEGRNNFQILHLSFRSELWQTSKEVEAGIHERRETPCIAWKLTLGNNKKLPS